MVNIHPRLKRNIIILVAIVSLAVLSGCNFAGKTETVTTTNTVTTTSTVATAVSGYPDFASVIARVRPSVVAINTEIPGYSLFGGTYTEEGAGSGWIIDPNGIIVTNSHVVEGASSVNITLEDGRTYPATAVYTDSFSDLAIVKIDAQNLPAARVGNSSTLNVGDWVIAIGNSLGLGISATMGIVSATDVTIALSADEEAYNLIQTDAAINPGNSGGPLVDLAGEVIGINSAKISEVGVEGMGYAISTEEATPILEQLIANGHVARPSLGVSVYAVDQYLASIYNLAVSQGVLVTQVAKGGPADTAGIKAGDVITAINDKDITSPQNLVLTLQDYNTGQEVQVTFYRGKDEQEVTVTLG